MTNKATGLKQVANAIIWAGVIIATSIVIADDVGQKDKFMIMMFHVIGWMTTSGLITKKKKSDNNGDT